MSFNTGTFENEFGPSHKRDDINIGRAAFFAPLICTVPFNGRPPRTRILSMVSIFLSHESRQKDATLYHGRPGEQEKRAFPIA
jgi:hypothetical protein